MFGKVPSLTYDGNSTYTTVWGGTISLIIKFGIWVYFYFRFINFATKNLPNRQSTTLRLNYETDLPFQPSDSGFSFALGLSKP